MITYGIYTQQGTKDNFILLTDLPLDREVTQGDLGKIQKLTGTYNVIAVRDCFSPIIKNSMHNQGRLG
jgi:hypothetical protein